MKESTDVLVIGGGPAGLATAIAARMKGFDVTVVDGAKPPIDKACGEGLMPSTAVSPIWPRMSRSPHDWAVHPGVSAFG